MNAIGHKRIRGASDLNAIDYLGNVPLLKLHAVFVSRLRIALQAQGRRKQAGRDGSRGAATTGGHTDRARLFG